MKQHSVVRPLSAGFSLVEMMVALVIGLVATLVIMQVFTLSEGRKRTTTGGADAQTNAAVTLYMLERDIRQAGYGLSPNTEDFVPTLTPPPTGVLTNGILAQCGTVRAYNANRATTPNFTYTGSTFAPVVINPPGYPAGDTNTDVILVNYSGTGGMTGVGVPITQSGGTAQTGGTLSDYAVVLTSNTTRAGFNQGDMILSVPPSGSTFDCTIGEVTGLAATAPPVGSQCTPGITGPANTISHNSMSYLSFYTGCTAVNAAWNQPGGTPVSYGPGSKLYNLGPVGSFVSRVYAVRNGALTVCDLTANDCTAAVASPPDSTVWAPIATGVVGLRAQYGKDTNFDGSIDAWDATQLTGANLAQIVAVRMAVVTRSNQYEKAADFTASAPLWHQDASGTADITMDISGSGTDWARYRYKVVQSIVPLRNMMWGQQK
ncbi:PilW family protein [Collimonas sp. OK307]|uniref:PilW family protein n=1 Tax=Collimonas sp. OK307 TaxID=1801620 RepID=UPI001C31A8A3|nr:PilW family protein [Collimonas sp. OK307]